MADRRRTSRYVVPEAAGASLLLMQDVYVEHADATHLVILANEPVRTGEGLTLEVWYEPRGRQALAVTLAPDRIRTMGSGERHRISLLFSEPSAGDDVDRRRLQVPSIGVLTRRVTVRVHDISMSGCLLESAEPLVKGAVGVLELSAEAQRYTETVRVSRTMSVTGSSWPYRAGGSFLALKAPPATSVRNVVARFELLDDIGAMPETLARVHRRGTIAFAARDRFAWSDSPR